MHLSPDQVSSYLGGALSDEETAALEGHIDGCADCRELISETVRSRYDEHVAVANTQVTAAQPPLPLSVGDIIDSRYRVERLLGVGGMGGAPSGAQPARRAEVHVAAVRTRPVGSRPFHSRGARRGSPSDGARGPRARPRRVAGRHSVSRDGAARR